MCRLSMTYTISNANPSGLSPELKCGKDFLGTGEEIKRICR